jgi:hypothetical protein
LGRLTQLCTLGGASSPPPMQFLFISGSYLSGYLAFTGPATSRHLLVTDAGHDAVHVVDVGHGGWSSTCRVRGCTWHHSRASGRGGEGRPGGCRCMEVERQWGPRGAAI